MINDAIATAKLDGHTTHSVYGRTSPDNALASLIATYHRFTYDKEWLERYLGKR